MDVKYKNIETKDQLLELINLLCSNSGQWENISAKSYLEALGAWLDDADGFYANHGLDTSADVPSWQLFADAIQAARIYE